MNPPNDLQIDHIDGNGLNNQKSNLRVVTHRENHQNRQHKKSSKFPGVSWNKKIKKWNAKIRIGNKSLHLGYFYDEEEASKAYSLALKQFVENKSQTEIERETTFLPKATKQVYLKIKRVTRG
jgi:hypothetical protein